MAGLIVESYGLSCLKITVKHDVGEVTLLTDPLLPDAGVKMPRGITADVVVATTVDPKQRPDTLVGGEPFIVDHPGEFEAKGIFVYGIAIPAKKGVRPQTVYRIEVGDLRVALLGPLQEIPGEHVLERLSDCDILLLPVGGQGVTLSARDAVDLLTTIEPRVVIPTWFALPGLSQILDPVEKFIKESGLVPENLERLKVAKKDLPQEETKLFVLRG
ncbi:MBL fold metallo-hydrolase [Patescibacteria group bacterium]|nr:MBL fold metallo-hydrolase [Patescibacteria group bacterium]